jgi:hypothetical protein
LDKYLQQAGFRKGSADNNLYIKVSEGNILLIEVYVDDIIFGSDDDKLRQKFAKDMQNEFEMSLLGELSFFWDFGYVKATKEYLFLKPSISEKC